LGCTHYPLLENSFSKVCGSSVELISSGLAVAEDLLEAFKIGRLARSKQNEKPKIEVYSTDAGEHFKVLAERILHPFHFENYLKIDL
ncbi:MAG: glutamate racemase, partial [Bdellovibrionales bacterium]|nr:glutamate racemase [Bdellovibrionales bacterium]